MLQRGQKALATPKKAVRVGFGFFFEFWQTQDSDQVWVTNAFLYLPPIPSFTVFLFENPKSTVQVVVHERCYI